MSTAKAMEPAVGGAGDGRLFFDLRPRASLAHRWGVALTFIMAQRIRHAGMVGVGTTDVCAVLNTLTHGPGGTGTS